MGKVPPDYVMFEILTNVIKTTLKRYREIHVICKSDISNVYAVLFLRV